MDMMVELLMVMIPTRRLMSPMMDRVDRSPPPLAGKCLAKP
jgi:hypothetical protein